MKLSGTGVLSGKRLLITGGTGSFGRAFVTYVLSNLDFERIVVFSRDELKQLEMSREIPDARVEYVIGDVRDPRRLQQAMKGVDCVVHAAALKQVPAGERNPGEHVKTNVFGAMNLIDAAVRAGVERVIALSTDKAAHPVNLYGATKLVAEKLFMAANAAVPCRGGPGTRFSIVRYGNVVGSRGSVVSLFREQRKSGVISITDPEMTRFLITLDQGVRFVSRALAAMRGGEVFVPKLPSVRIVDLAAAVAPGCRVEVVGIRPGEKLHEVLITPEESARTFEFDDFYVIEPDRGATRAAAATASGAAHPSGIVPVPGDRPDLDRAPGLGDAGFAQSSSRSAQTPPAALQGWPGGRRVEPGFMYASHTNPWRLTVTEIRQLLEAIGYA